MTHPGHMTLTPVKRQWPVFSRRHSHSLVVSAKAKAGLKQIDVSKQLNVSVRSVRNMAVLSPHK